MAHALYDQARNSLLRAEINWLTQDFKMVLVDDTLYTLDASNHTYLSDIPVAARVAISQSLPSRSLASGAARCGSTTFPAVPPHGPCAMVVVFQDTGNPATSRLICWDKSAAGLPITPDGTPISVHPSAGAYGLFRP
jgi:hypothetical protein